MVPGYLAPHLYLPKSLRMLPTMGAAAAAAVTFDKHLAVHLNTG